MTDVQLSARKERKTFAKNKNANGVFVIELVIDLANPNSEWFTGGHIYDTLSMDTEDDTEFRNFYHEIYERSKNMDDYEAYTGDPIEDSFVVRDGSGKSFLYTVSLDGYLHGVILEKSDVNALKSVLLKGALATKMENPLHILRDAFLMQGLTIDEMLPLVSGLTQPTAILDMAEWVVEHPKASRKEIIHEKIRLIKQYEL